MKKTKRTLLVLLVLVLTLVLSGCAKVAIHLTINEDGSSDLDYKFAVEEATLAMMQQSGQDPFAELTANAKDKGFTTSDYKEGGYVGFVAKKHISTPDELASMNLLGNQEGLPGLTVKKSFFETTYAIDGDFDLTSMKANTGSESDAMSNSIIEQFEVKYILTLPETASVHNATSVSEDKKTLTWDLKPGENNKIQIQATVKNTGNIVLVVGLVLAVLLGGVFIGTRKKKSVPTAPSVVAEPTTPEGPVVTEAPATVEETPAVEESVSIEPAAPTEPQNISEPLAVEPEVISPDSTSENTED